MKNEYIVNTLEKMIERVQSEQGWNNDTVLGLLKQFLWDRQDKWQFKSMIADLETTLSKIAKAENE